MDSHEKAQKAQDQATEVTENTEGKLEELCISYTDDDDEKFPEYIRFSPVINEEFFGTGIRINTGVPFTIKPDDIEKIGYYLLEIAKQLKSLSSL